MQLRGWLGMFIQRYSKIFKDIQSRNPFHHISIFQWRECTSSAFSTWTGGIKFAHFGTILWEPRAVQRLHTHNTHTHRHTQARTCTPSFGVVWREESYKKYGKWWRRSNGSHLRCCPDSWLSLILESYLWSGICPNRQVKPSAWEHWPKRGKQFALQHSLLSSARGNVLSLQNVIWELESTSLKECETKASIGHVMSCRIDAFPRDSVRDIQHQGAPRSR